MITFGEIKFSTTPTLSGRLLIYVDIIYNDNLYNWAIYIPKNQNVDEYLINNATNIENDIENKEILWSNMPHTKIIFDHFLNKDVEIEIKKEEIVKPTIPDGLEITQEQRTDELETTIIKLKNLLKTKGIVMYDNEDWHYLEYAKRIIAPIKLVMQQASLEVWFTINGLPIVKKGNTLYCYCNVILPEHQTLFDQYVGIVSIEDRPKEKK